MRYVRLSTIALAMMALMIGTTASYAKDWPMQVWAKYRISIAGIKVGDFYFNSQRKGRQYRLDGDARLSILLGAFKWKGKTASSGIIKGAMPYPDAYEYNYRASRKKKGGVKMRFVKQNVSQLDIRPNKKPSSKAVPLKPNHLQNVLDPLSAILALTLADRGNPCARKVQIFDGKIRFDLVFRYHSKTIVETKHGFAARGPAYICRIKFIPIAGYRKNRTIREITRAKRMEVLLRPITKHKILVPIVIRMPSIIGEIAVSMQRVDIITKGTRQIALAN